MGLNAKNVSGGGNGSKFKAEVLEPGVYPGRLVQIIDLGVQPQRPFQGKDKPPAQEVMLTYELVDEFLKDEDGNEIEDKPRWQSETFPLHSLNADRAKSTQRYNAFDPTHEHGGDFAACIGLPCNVTLVTNEKDDRVYVNVANVSAMRPRDAQKCAPLVNDPKVFDLDEPDIEVFNALPEWIQDKIKSNLNFSGSALEKIVGNAPAPKDKAPKKQKEEEPEEEFPEEEISDEDRPW